MEKTGLDNDNHSAFKADHSQDTEELLRLWSVLDDTQKEALLSFLRNMVPGLE